MSTNYLKGYRPGLSANNSGGPAYKITPMQRAARFLVTGSDGTYYEPGAKLTADNAESIIELAKSDKAQELIDLIVSVSEDGRASKQSYGLFALALVQANASGEAKTNAYRAVDKVCRTLSTLTEWMSYHENIRGTRGPAYLKAIRRWFDARTADDVAYQAVKYRKRNGWTIGDVARIAHPITDTAKGSVIDWSVRGEIDPDITPAQILAFQEVQKADPKDIPGIIDASDDMLTWEMVPTEYLNDPTVLAALAETMPMGALLRNITRFYKAGLLAPGSRVLEILAVRFSDTRQIRASRLHPINILVAVNKYIELADSDRMDHWAYWNLDPYIDGVTKILYKAFYLAFGNVEPTGKRTFIALDVSGSMMAPISRDMPVTCREAALAMSLITANTEEEVTTVVFQRKVDKIDLPMSIHNAVNQVKNMPFGTTDIAAAINYALNNKIAVDTFIIYTDNETNYSRENPADALRRYREVMGIPARLVVMAFTASSFSVADPDDAGMLDIAGMDAASPKVIASFAKGEI